MFRLDFNSRSPCGERPFTSLGNLFYIKFQLTLPVWGATEHRISLIAARKFQLTLPVWGATTQFCIYRGEL